MDARLSFLDHDVEPTVREGKIVILGSKTKEIMQLSNLLGQEQSFGPKKFKLGYGSKVWRNEVVKKWHHMPAKSWQSLLKEILPLV